MPDVVFYHKDVVPKELTVTTGANQITWGYGLNTQTVPTYGGEVVQILSAYVDDLVVSGEVGSYAQQQEIYSWFLQYMQIASQGNDPANPNFNEHPIDFRYPERGWHLLVRVNQLPGFRQATETVAPAWQIQAAVVEPDQAMNKYTLETAEANGFDFNRLHGGIGYDEDNPFTNAFAHGSKYDPQQYEGKITDFYQTLLPSYLEGDFDSLFSSSEQKIGSAPTSPNRGDPNKDTPGGTPGSTSINAILGEETTTATNSGNSSSGGGVEETNGLLMDTGRSRKWAD
jgi:hypothetical protein